ncbi:unnamed protein product [Camellia sinensis]
MIQDPQMITLDLDVELDLDEDEDEDQDSDPLSPSSPNQTEYFVQSPPSSESHDGGDSNRSPMQQSTQSDESSPLNSSLHSLSSGSRFSSRSWKVNWKLFPPIDEVEETFDDFNLFDKCPNIRPWHCLLLLFGSVFLFTLLCLIIGGISRPYRPRVAIESLMVNNFYFGEGSDYAGVPTEYLTVNCSVEMTIYNPAKFFGMHVSFTPAGLFYYEITVATGQLKKYYQPRKSHHIVSLNLEGKRVPLYGAGPSLVVSDSRGGVPCRLEFDIRSLANVVGVLVRTKHRMHISCSLTVNSRNTEAIKFKENPCRYD